MGTPTIQSVSAEATYPLRRLVLRAGRPASTCIWDSDTLPSTRHFAAMDGRDIVAVGSLYDRPHVVAPGPGAWQIRGMATHPDHRSKGLGTQLLEFMLQVCREELDGRTAWCNARTPAVPFYRRHGFVCIGGEFEIAEIGPHFVMRRSL